MRSMHSSKHVLETVLVGDVTMSPGRPADWGRCWCCSCCGVRPGREEGSVIRRERSGKQGGSERRLEYCSSAVVVVAVFSSLSLYCWWMVV